MTNDDVDYETLNVEVYQELTLKKRFKGVVKVPKDLLNRFDLEDVVASTLDDEQRWGSIEEDGPMYTTVKPIEPEENL